MTNINHLGTTLSIEEQDATNMVVYANQMEVADESSVCADELSDIPVQVSLRVRFELLEAPEKETATSVQK